ncbi:MAG: hypothetical protein ABI579_08580 [Candidatus Sumerlaeota bacterium]
MLTNIFNARSAMKLVFLVAFLFMAGFTFLYYFSNSPGLKAYRELKVGTVDGTVGNIEEVKLNPLSKMSQVGRHYILPVEITGNNGSRKLWVEIEGDEGGKWNIVRESDVSFSDVAKDENQ